MAESCVWEAVVVCCSSLRMPLPGARRFPMGCSSAVAASCVRVQLFFASGTAVMSLGAMLKSGFEGFEGVTTLGDDVSGSVFRAANDGE